MSMRTISQQLQALVRPGDTFWWGQTTAEPLTLTRTLVEHRHQIGQGGRLQVFVGLGLSDTLQPAHADVIDFFGYAASGPHRNLAKAGVLDILPTHYSQLPQLLEQGRIPADVVFVQVSPPDAQGRYSMGQVREYMPAAMERARVLVGEVHPDVPWTFGGPYLQASDFDLLIDSDTALLDMERSEPGVAEQSIAQHIAGLVEDGSCIQLGVGNLPEAVTAALRHHKDLGLHSGAIGNGIADLAEAGAITNARKSIDTGIGIAGVLMGGARLRQWAHGNAQLQVRGTDYTHNIDVLSRIDKFVAINSGIEVDLTGQINAEVAGGVYMGAVGGAMDFFRGAARSKGGLPILALPATAKTHSRIVASLSGPVSTPRADAGLIVTEYGVADLRGLPLSKRVRCMIDIAAPEHRELLAQQAHNLLCTCGAAFTSV